jgi:hypothetical protein
MFYLYQTRDSGRYLVANPETLAVSYPSVAQAMYIAYLFFRMSTTPSDEYFEVVDGQNHTVANLSFHPIPENKDMKK